MTSGFVVRLDDQQAVIEAVDRLSFTVDRRVLPAGVQLGDFVEENPETGSFHIDHELTEKRKQDMRRIADISFD